MLISLQYTGSDPLTIISTRPKRHGWRNLFSVEEKGRDKKEGKRRKEGREPVQTRLAV